MNELNKTALTLQHGYGDLPGFALVAIGTWGLLGALAIAASLGLPTGHELSTVLVLFCGGRFCISGLEDFENLGGIDLED